MDPAEQQITVPEVALFLHSADTFGRRHISISLASLVSLMLRQEIVEVQRIFIGKSIGELPNEFDAPSCVPPATIWTFPSIKFEYFGYHFEIFFQCESPF
jgi:hypothetical protein